MHKCASQLSSPIRCGSMSLLIESTSHSQLGGRGACSPDVELANPRRRRDISFDAYCTYLTLALRFSHNAIYYITNKSKKQYLFQTFLLIPQTNALRSRQVCRQAFLCPYRWCLRRGGSLSYRPTECQNRMRVFLLLLYLYA